jgi:hypothetical protein
MAVKNRPGSARRALGQQMAQSRRGAPGKRFIGETADQSASARLAQREKVGRMAEEDTARRRAQEPLSAILFDLAENTYRLARTLVAAPFRLAQALRRPHEA